MMSNKEFAVFAPKHETKMESAFSNIKFIVMFSFLVYISQGSTWWTFVSGSIFLIILFSRVAKYIKRDTITFKTKAELQKWVDGIEENDNGN
jgi:hypothetical protein